KCKTRRQAVHMITGHRNEEGAKLGRVGGPEFLSTGRVGAGPTAPDAIPIETDCLLSGPVIIFGDCGHKAWHRQSCPAFVQKIIYPVSCLPIRELNTVAVNLDDVLLSVSTPIFNLRIIGFLYIFA